MLDWVLTGFAIEAWDLEKKDLLIEPLCAFRKRQYGFDDKRFSINVRTCWEMKKINKCFGLIPIAAIASLLIIELASGLEDNVRGDFASEIQ